jgi:hypothetical protein
VAARISNAYASDFEPEDEDDDEDESEEDDELSDFFSACFASFLFAPDSAEAADWRLRFAVP